MVENSAEITPKEEPLSEPEVAENGVTSTPEVTAKNGKRNAKNAGGRGKNARKTGRKRATNKRRRVSKFDSDDERLKNRFLRRVDDRQPASDRKQRKMEMDRGPVVREYPPTSSDRSSMVTYGVVNPIAYDRLLNRLEDTQSNKPVKPTNGATVLDTPWVCALCQQRSCERSLGDLFGPYFVPVSPGTFWPPFLARARRRSASNVNADESADDPGSHEYADLWFHGDCLFWASGILFRGSRLTGLDEYLPEYWQQKCLGCQNLGASISCSAKNCHKIFHYACAVDAGCLLKESALSLYCDSHKMLAMQFND